MGEEGENVTEAASSRGNEREHMSTYHRT
jgi:hypothetical protein